MLNEKKPTNQIAFLLIDSILKKFVGHIGIGLDTNKVAENQLRSYGPNEPTKIP